MIGTSLMMKDKNINCPNNELIIIFNIFDIKQNTSLIENTCEYIFNIHSQSTYISIIEYQELISAGVECKGTDVEIPSLDVQLTYDFTSLYKTTGDLISINNSLVEKKLRFSICGIIDSESVSCDGSDWCLEEVMVSNVSECVGGISKWQETNDVIINYYANCFVLLYF